MNDKLDTNALFLGPKAENAEVFEKLILTSLRDHIFWRRNFHPTDPDIIAQSDKRIPEFEDTVDKMESKFYELISRLKSSVPFYSPRYLGHMTSDLLMPALIGYFSSMLYNQNNVCYEASPVTSEFEVEVGRDLARMMGFNPSKAWGHLTSGGTVANIEALWVIRNTKYFPLIAKDLAKKYNIDFNIKLANGDKRLLSLVNDEYTLLSLAPDSLSELTLNFLKQNWAKNIQNEIYSHPKNISHSGMYNVPACKILVPSSKHYSWPKAAEILGLGRSNIEHVNVDSNFRIDIDDLKNKLKKLYKQKIPVLAVIGIVGSTECGSIDPIHKIVELREWYEKNCNSSFYIHVDGAYGGYPRSIFLNENYDFRSIEDIKNDFQEDKCFTWPSLDLYNSYKAIQEVDSVTIDPHKLGYIPYPAGAIVYKDKRIKPATLCKAPYINNTTKAEDEDSYIGGYILEGSKSGAAAAACWLAHNVTPLNQNGYGKLISAPIKDACRIYEMLNKNKVIKIDVKGKITNINTKLFNIPDLDILLYVFNLEDNTSLEKMNKFNALVLDELSFHKEKVLGAHEFIISSTDFEYEVYGDSINPMLSDLGINVEDWVHNIKLVKLLRTSVVTPLVTKEKTKDFYINNFEGCLIKSIEKVVCSNQYEL